jgi:hypothetical protein
MTTMEEQGLWPSLNEAARIVGVSPSTLSRQARVGRVAYERVGLGRGRHVLPPGEVVRLGRLYRRVPERELLRRLRAVLEGHAGREVDLVLHTAQGRIQIEITGGHETPTGPATPPRWLTAVDALLADSAPLAGLPFFDDPAAPLASVSPGRSIDDMPIADDDDWLAPVRGSALAPAARR